MNKRRNKVNTTDINRSVAALINFVDKMNDEQVDEWLNPSTLKE